MAPDHEHVFVRGLDGRGMWQKWWTAAGGWSGWIALGEHAGGLRHRPATIARGTGICNVYVRGNDNALWMLAYTPASGIPGTCTETAACWRPRRQPARSTPNHEHVFVRGTDGQV